jgi:hypothetical protein
MSFLTASLISLFYSKKIIFIVYFHSDLVYHTIIFILIVNYFFYIFTNILNKTNRSNLILEKSNDILSRTELAAHPGPDINRYTRAE